jgi:hypothetical protein
MPVDQKANQPIPMTMPIALERIQQLTDFRLCQVFSHPVLSIGFAHWPHYTLFGLPDWMRGHWEISLRVGEVVALWG